MNRFAIFCAICLLTFSGSALAQPSYLIRIDQVNKMTIQQIERTEIEVYAKTADFWIAGAHQEDLKFLAKSQISFQVLDQEADIGEHYLVWSKPSEEIKPYVPEIDSVSRILVTEGDMAVVKGNPRKIEELASLGLSLRRIQKQPLPVEPTTYVSSYLESLSRAYDPMIDSIVNRVDQAQLLSWIDDLSGEDTVLIGGIEDSIKTRYSYSEGIFKAADYLKERFEDMGLSVAFDTFQVDGFGAYLLDVACSPDGEKAWSVSWFGGILITTDGGGLWSLIDETKTLEFYDIFRVDDDTLWSVGYGGIIVRSTNGGNSWQDRSRPEFSTLDFKRGYFEDANHGWVAGDQGIWFTSDGGASWTEQVHATGQTLYGIDFVDPYRGWTVGTGGAILHTTDRGTNWNPQTSGTSIRLRSVDFIDRFNGWACGDDGWAIYTTDGGANWTRKTLPTSYNLNNIDFVDSLHGWMVGFDGSIFYTSDLGVNWVPQASNTYYLYGVDFADTLVGWATGYYEIIKTTNGGQNWFSQWGNVEPLNLFNVVATIEGQSYPGRQVLITGHYDDVSENSYNWAPGADDNASGTVTLLAAAILKDYDLANTVKFVAFSAEELGLLGSAAYAQEAYNRGDTIVGVLNFDMIAWDGNADDVIEVHCGDPSENQALADLLIGAISDYGLSLSPEKITSGATDRSDHASFWDWGYPAILGIEDFDDFNPFYHTTGDRVTIFDTSYYVDFTRAAVAGISILADPFLVGDANGNGAIGPGDVVYLINYLFRQGPQPDPPQAGDANHDGEVGPGDIVYLINYLFRNGPPPSR
ncbi:MAG: M20/M25/M40 family metallo-hydrolase [candidate division Zixibacteria bacterium]|nr:M20/M25/M40 family metallo-hydrolase [candidate division Zixibacteria bacterium]